METENKSSSFQLFVIQSYIACFTDSKIDANVARRPAFVLCRTQGVTAIIKSRQLEIVTLANLSSLTVSFTICFCVLFSWIPCILLDWHFFHF